MDMEALIADYKADFMIRRIRQMEPVGARMQHSCPPPHWPRQVRTSYIDFNGQRYTRVEGVGDEEGNMIHLEGEVGFDEAGRYYCELFTLSMEG